MKSKQVYDLTLADLNAHSVWFFPMDETVRNEASVCPLLEKDDIGERCCVVKTRFVGSDNSEYAGYVYWADSQEARHLQPVLFVRNDCYVTFWNGMSVPTWSDGPPEVQALRKVLPLSYYSESFEGLPAVTGTLEGLYYRDHTKTLCCIR
ncbi:hypothetical protein HX792_07240 [Pseudomonas sp. B6002]|uniref:hypothetical protein n=1 Tax=Pseudomonas sp. B6002 TaxID=2726978 RepID=UPI0015A2D205|nr:hypothetical protein [Pseudomonas sp. B6002]NVZ50122.1 hypothetical protein [Pseudomonas sp. B6002]